MRTLNIDDFMLEVKAEIKHLKEHATAEEIGRLNFETFCGQNSRSCIYGQMTGNCHSSRAVELYHKSIHILFIEGDKVIIHEGTPDDAKLTSMEKYLFHSSKTEHGKIINYLKGKCDKLDLQVDKR